MLIMHLTLGRALVVLAEAGLVLAESQSIIVANACTRITVIGGVVTVVLIVRRNVHRRRCQKRPADRRTVV